MRGHFAAYVKYMRPDIKIIGVEPDDADSLYQALKAKKRVKLGAGRHFRRRGRRRGRPARKPFRINRELRRRASIRVSTDEMCAAIKDIFNDTRSVAEPAGALAVAGRQDLLPKNAGANAKTRVHDLVGGVSAAPISISNACAMSPNARRSGETARNSFVGNPAGRNRQLC